MRNITTILKITKGFFFNNIVNIVFVILATYVFTLSGQAETSNPEIIFFDVGQGDAILIQQDNFQILIDGGPDDAIIYHLAKKMPADDKTIEIVVLTHPHEDHIRGLMNVLDEFTVEKVFINRIEYENKAYRYLLENYEDILVQVKEGDTFKYGEVLGTVIYPPKEKKVQDRNINNESVAILTEVQDYRVLLMGDAEHEVERRLLESHYLENIYILKAGHHCSKTSTSDMFLNVTNPQLAICSCGEGNKFGHPDYETLEKFQNLGVQYLVTYKEGNIVIKFNDL